MRSIDQIQEKTNQGSHRPEREMAGDRGQRGDQEPRSLLDPGQVRCRRDLRGPKREGGHEAFNEDE